MVRTCGAMVLIALAAGGLFAAAPTAAGEITLESLLKEMLDRDAVARWPDPPYTCRQASSYDRKSKTPDDPAGWFANQDWSHFLRSEEHKGRCEWVLMDADGPGCVVRQWWGGKFPPKGAVLRFYLDGAGEPAIEGYPHDLLAGGALVGKPLSMENGKAPPGAPGGMNLYLPIPYAKHCKITYSEPDATDPAKPPQKRWYNIEYRTYPVGTQVKTFAMGDLKALGPKVDEVLSILKEAGSAFLDWPKADELTECEIRQAIEPGKAASVDLPAGPKAIRELQLGIGPLTEAPQEVLRSAVLRIQFDGEETIWCPVNDFVGSGVGLNETHSWYRSAWSCGLLLSRWVMPYEKSARITLMNLGKRKVEASVGASVTPWK